MEIPKCVTSPPPQCPQDSIPFYTQTKICSSFINLMFIIKKFMNLMYNPRFISFLQHMPDRSILLYPALSQSSSVSHCSGVLHLWTGSVHKISIFKPSEFQMKVLSHAFRIPVQRIPLVLWIPVQSPPPCPQNSKKPSVMVYGHFLELDIFWNYPLYWPLSMAKS